MRDVVHCRSISPLGGPCLTPVLGGGLAQVCTRPDVPSGPRCPCAETTKAASRQWQQTASNPTSCPLAQKRRSELAVVEMGADVGFAVATCCGFCRRGRVAGLLVLVHCRHWYRYWCCLFSLVCCCCCQLALALRLLLLAPLMWVPSFPLTTPSPPPPPPSPGRGKTHHGHERKGERCWPVSGFWDGLLVDQASQCYTDLAID